MGVLVAVSLEKGFFGALRGMGGFGIACFGDVLLGFGCIRYIGLGR